MKKISIESQEVVKDFPMKCGYYQTIMLAPGDESLFIYEMNCHLKLIDFTDGGTIKDFGRCGNGSATFSQRILVTRNAKYLVTTSNEGGLKQCSVGAKTLVQDFGNLGHIIFSICD